MIRLRVLFLLICAATTALGQTATRTPRKLNLEECIVIALRHNLDIQIKKFNPDIARYALGTVYGAYDPLFGFSGDHSYNVQPGGIDQQGRPYGGTETESDSFTTGIQGLLPWGLTYNLSGTMSDNYGTRPAFVNDPNNPNIVTNNIFDINTSQTISFLTTNPTLQVRSPFENTVGNVGFLTLRQPLLKNFWIDSTRLQILLDKKNVQISELDLQSQLMTTVTTVEQAYYLLIYAQENIKVQETALELAERLLAENKKRVEVGALAPLDEKQAESQVSGSRADLLAAEGTEDTQQRVLKSLLSDDYSQWKDVHIEPAESMVAVPQSFNLQESWQKGLTLRPDLLQQRLTLEKQGFVVRFSKNQLYPQLDVVGGYGYNASSTEFSGAFNQIADRDNPFWSAGGQLTIPLSQTTARNNYKSAKASKEQIELQLKQLQQLVLIQIENSIATAQTSFQRVDATREARIYAEAALEAEQKKLENGKSTSFVVLQLQKNLTSARSDEIKALADYNIALAQVSLQEGSTLERHKLELNATSAGSGATAK